MKIIAFCGSPRKGHGMTDKLLDMFLGSAKKAGAEVSKHYVTDLNINGCSGCFACWWSTPGKCVHRDDMDWMLEEILDSDIQVWAGPVYHDNIIHYLQKLRERTLPLALPEFLVKEDGESTHPGRYKRSRKTVAIATAGFPDSSAFDVVKRLFQNALHIHLPASQTLVMAPDTPIIKDFTEAVSKAAEKLVKGDEIGADLRDVLMVEYPFEVKEEIVKRHNEMSAKFTPSG